MDSQHNNKIKRNINLKFFIFLRKKIVITNNLKLG